MIALFENYARMFSPQGDIHAVEYSENIQEAKCVVELHLAQQLSARINLEAINARDTLQISILESNGPDASTEISYLSTDSDNNWDVFVQQYDGIDKDDSRRIVLKIAKTSCNDSVSIYDKDAFLDYLNGLTFNQVIHTINDRIENHNRIFEIQGDFDNIVAGNVAFVSKDFVPTFSSPIADKQSVILKANQFCCCEIIKSNLIPSDLFVVEKQGDGDYVKLLNKLTILYAACFIFDYVKCPNTSFDYKLNGFKSYSDNIESTTIGTVDIATLSAHQYCEIFLWVYTGGNTLDKLVIARNIISLNLTDSKKLSISDKTIDAIISNYRIYEKENVKQYIGIRNDISKQLRDYQKEVIKTVDEFDGDFKKVFFTFLTFIFTTTLIRVLSKNINMTTLIPDEIILLLLLYSILSLCYFFYARYVLDEKIKLIDNQYTKTRNFYNEILSDKEQSDLFDDVRNNEGSYQAFQKERKTKYKILWLRGVIIVVIGLVLLLINNHWSVLTEINDKLYDLYRIYKDSEQCCPHCR